MFHTYIEHQIIRNYKKFDDSHLVLEGSDILHELLILPQEPRVCICPRPLNVLELVLEVLLDLVVPLRLGKVCLGTVDVATVKPPMSMKAMGDSAPMLGQLEGKCTDDGVGALCALA